MLRRRWLLLVVVAIPTLMGVLMCIFTSGFLAYFAFIQTQPSALEVRDPNSPTVVRVEPIAMIGDGPAEWGCTISADGQRPTQHAGWPTDRVAAHAQPTAVIWHNDPDWVEIVLSSGERLKLTWDKDAAERARASHEQHYFLNPRYEVLRNR